MVKKLVVLSLILFQISCNDGPGDFVQLFEDSNLLLQYQEDGDFINFEIDALGDLTDSLGTAGLWDHYKIYVDYRLNEEIDFNEDFLLSNLDDGRTCRSEFLENGVLTPCEFSNDWRGESIFGESPASTTPHVYHQMKIKKSELSAESNRASVIVHVFDRDRGWLYFPQEDIDFSSALNISW